MYLPDLDGRHPAIFFQVDMPGKGFFQQMRCVAAVLFSAADIIKKLFPVKGMSAISDDDPGPFSRGQSPQIGDAPFGDEDMNVMLRTVHMGTQGNDAGYFIVLCG